MKLLDFRRILLTSCSVLACVAGRPVSAAEPRLVVLVVVDQFRADYIDRFRDVWRHGVRRLLDQGAIYPAARVPFVPTDTAPGHAALSTGFAPRTTGIVGNRWWNREDARVVTAVGDDVDGRSPRRLAAPTAGDVLKKTFPSALVVSLSQKDRSAVLLGGASADLALWFDRDARGFRSSAFYPAAPDWVETVNADAFSGLRARSRLSIKEAEDFLGTPDSDAALAALAREALARLPLGRDAIPDLLLLSFSGMDYAGHAHGPYSAEIRDQLSALDRHLGELLSALDETVGDGAYAVVLTSDHGILPVPESAEGRAMGAKRVRIDRFRESLESALQQIFSMPEDRWVEAFTPPHLYLNRGLVDKLGVSWDAFLARAANAVELLPDVANVLNPHRPGIGDRYDDAFWRGYHPERSGDLLVRFKEGVLVKPYFVQTGHGSPYDYDALVPIVVWADDAGAGVRTDAVTILSVAPTLLRLLDVPIPAEWEGTPLIEAPAGR